MVSCPWWPFWLKTELGHQGIGFVFEVTCLPMWPGPSVSTLSGVRTHYGLEDRVWSAFIQAAGDCGDDPRPLAALPPAVFRRCVMEATFPDAQRLSVMQASQIGMVYRAVRRLVHLQGGGTVATWEDVDPWMEETGTLTRASTGGGTVTTSERKLKFGQIIDQQDDGEFLCDAEEFRGKCYGKYSQLMGGLPLDAEDPTLEQLSALSKRVKVHKLAPYVDYGVWVPFQRRVWKSNKYTTFMMMENGTFASKLVPGPACYAHWVASFRVMRTAFITLELVSLNGLIKWEAHMERLVQRYPGCWHLLVEAENKARSEHLSKTLMKVKLDMDTGRRPPVGWSAEEPWNIIWNMVLEDAEFWQEQVHIPALSWMARGSKGVQRTPAEEIAAAAINGGSSKLHPTEEGQREDLTPIKSANRVRREAKKRKLQAEREELKSLRNQKGGGKGGGGHGHGGKPSGSGEEECFAWNNGNGACKDLPPGEPCAGKKARLHRCTTCKSPGHPSKDCPNRKKG